ncbi:CYCA1-1, partial [Linum perenne]
HKYRSTFHFASPSLFTTLNKPKPPKPQFPKSRRRTNSRPEYEFPMQTRRSSSQSSTASSLAKRNAENAGKHAAAAAVSLTAPTATTATRTANLTRKRNPLGDITNIRRNAPRKVSSKPALPSSSAAALAQNSSRIAKRGRPPTEIAASKVTSRSNHDAAVVSSKSDGVSMPTDETMSTCDSHKCSEAEHVEDNRVSDDVAENVCSRDSLGVVDMDTDEKIVNIDADIEDPQLCGTIACDIYKHLRASENKKRPTTDFMERTQTDIDASMRAILIDWLVEVAEEYELVPDTLYLAVNYIDRYLSGNVINRKRLQLLGVACMMIAAKYEEICAPHAGQFCFITDNTYFKDEVTSLKRSHLSFLHVGFCLLSLCSICRRFVRASQGLDEVPSMQLECLASYIAELSLLEYNMLCHPPSVVAASSIFLAKFIISPSRRPWNSTLQHYTLYQPSDLLNCIKDLHHLCCSSNNPTLSAIRDKYSTHKYKIVAKKLCPPHIPEQYFHMHSS